MKPILFAALSVVLAGCAAPATRWEKPGASQAAVDEAVQECRVRARLTLPPSASPSTATRMLSREEELALHETQHFQDCMRDRGYSAGTR